MHLPHQPLRLHLRSLRALVVGGLALAALMAGASCGTADRAPSSTEVSIVPDQTVPPFTVGTTPPTDTEPMLELSDVCYGLCSAVPAGGLPAVAVYPDGTIVRYGYASATGDPQSGLAGYEGRLDATTLATLVDEARAADLTVGGVGVNGTTKGTADGGGIRLVARLDGMDTAFEIPFLDMSADPADPSARSADDSDAESPSGPFDGSGGDPEQRAALGVVARHLRDLGTEVAVTPRRGSGWALLAAPTTGDPKATWSAVDVAGAPTLPGLVSDSPELGVASGTPMHCLVLPIGDDHVAPLVVAPAGWLIIRSGDGLWAVSARPLMPHEHSCADVATSVTDEHAGELAALRAR